MATEWTYLLWEERKDDGELVMCGAKPHFAPSTNNIVEHVIKDIVGRYTAEGRTLVTTRKISRKCVVDLPGMVMADRSWISFPIDNVKIEMPSADVEVILRQIEEYELRWFKLDNGRSIPYYKIHFWNRCVCLTPNQRGRLSMRMKRALPECRAIAEHEAHVWNDRMAGANKHPNLRVEKKPVRGVDEA